jgi:hypothetical protein
MSLKASRSKRLAQSILLKASGSKRLAQSVWLKAFAQSLRSKPSLKKSLRSKPSLKASLSKHKRDLARKPHNPQTPEH